METTRDWSRLGTTTAKEISERDKTRISEAEKKATKLGYQVKIRLAYLGTNTSEAQLKMQAIVGTFKQFNSTNLNGFRMTGASFSKEKVDDYRKTNFYRRRFYFKYRRTSQCIPFTTHQCRNTERSLG